MKPSEFVKTCDSETFAPIAQPVRDCTPFANLQAIAYAADACGVVLDSEPAMYAWAASKERVELAEKSGH